MTFDIEQSYFTSDPLLLHSSLTLFINHFQSTALQLHFYRDFNDVGAGAGVEPTTFRLRTLKLTILFCQSFCFPLCSSRLRYILSNRLPLHLPFLIHFSFLCFSIFLFPHPLSSFYINFSFLAFLFPLCNPIPSAYSLSSFSFLSLPFSLFLILTLFNSHPF